MMFDPNTLLKMPSFSTSFAPKDALGDCVNEAIVSGINTFIELRYVHNSLQAEFAVIAQGVRVDLKEAAFIRPEPTQECRIDFSRAVEPSLVETTIHRVLEHQYNGIGLLYDPRDIHIVLANF